MSGAERQRRRRARKAAGRRIWHLDLDIVRTEQLLADAGYLDGMADHTELDVDAALARLVEMLCAVTRDTSPFGSLLRQKIEAEESPEDTSQ
jgi:hypothetical protein